MMPLSCFFLADGGRAFLDTVTQFLFSKTTTTTPEKKAKFLTGGAAWLA